MKDINSVMWHIEKPSFLAYAKMNYVFGTRTKTISCSY